MYCNASGKNIKEVYTMNELSSLYAVVFQLAKLFTLKSMAQHCMLITHSKFCAESSGKKKDGRFIHTENTRRKQTEKSS